MQFIYVDGLVWPIMYRVGGGRGFGKMAKNERHLSVMFKGILVKYLSF